MCCWISPNESANCVTQYRCGNLTLHVSLTFLKSIITTSYSVGHTQTVHVASDNLRYFFFNRHCNPCGFWPAQLSLSILSRKVFTECRCQWHVKPPTWRTSDLERSTFHHKVSPASETTQANPSSGRWKYGREIAENFCRKWRLPRHFWVLLHAVNLRHGTDGFTSPPKEGVLRIFFARKIRQLRPGLNPRTRVPKASTLTSRPPKPQPEVLHQDILTKRTFDTHSCFTAPMHYI